MPGNETGFIPFAERLGEIVERCGEVSNPRVTHARFELIIGKLHQRVMDADRHGVPSGRMLSHEETRVVALERERDFHLGIGRKSFCSW